MMSRSPRRKTLGQRIKDHIFFSVVSMTAIFVILSLIGIKAKLGSFLLSVLITLALNVGLTYYYEYRARKDAEAAQDPAKQKARDADIRWRE